MSRLLDRVREALRARHYSIRTEEAYLRRIRQYILFFDRRHPSELGSKEVSAFVSHLASGRRVAASTQSQALSALLFLYREVLDLPIEWVDDVERARKPRPLVEPLRRQLERAERRHHISETALQKAVKAAVMEARIDKPGTTSAPSRSRSGTRASRRR